MQRLQEKREELDKQLEALQRTEQVPDSQLLIQSLVIVEQWLRVVKEEVGYLEGCLENMPEGPVLLYIVAPPPGALPLFTLSYIQESRNLQMEKNMKILQRRSVFGNPK